MGGCALSPLPPPCRGCRECRAALSKCRAEADSRPDRCTIELFFGRRILGREPAVVVGHGDLGDQDGQQAEE
ncbi:MAG: hypothetical protein AAF725_23025, partial [Acidobacteriota bacterium]